MKVLSSVSIVVPTRNDNSTDLKMIIRRIEKLLLDIQGNHEIVLVDDFSGNGNFREAIRALRSEKFSYPIKIVSLAKWAGQLQATRYGFENSSRKWVLAIDDDKCLNSESLRHAISQATEFGLDFIVCCPLENQASRTRLRNFGTSVIRNIGQIAYRTSKDHSFSSIILFKSSYIVPLSQSSDFMTIPGWFYNSTSRFGNISVDIQNFSRPSNYSIRKLVKLFLQLLQVMELRVLKSLSFVFALGIFVAVTYLFFNIYVAKNPPSGYLSLSAIALINVAMSLLNGLVILSLRSNRLNRRETRIHYEVEQILTK